MFEPIRYVGFSMCGWESEGAVLNTRSNDATRIELDFDGFPYALRDVQTVKKFADEHKLPMIAYFTGSKGCCITFGFVKLPYYEVRWNILRLASTLNLSSTDLSIYKGIDRWIAPPGTLNRSSGLPSFIMEKIPEPEKFYDLYKTSARILEGKHLSRPNPKGISQDTGERLIKIIEELYQKLPEERRNKIDRYIKRKLREIKAKASP